MLDSDEKRKGRKASLSNFSWMSRDECEGMNVSDSNVNDKNNVSDTSYVLSNNRNERSNKENRMRASSIALERRKDRELNMKKIRLN